MSGCTTLSHPAGLHDRRVAARPGRRGAWGAWLARMLRAVETRRQLAAMDDRTLADIGISRADAVREAARAPWDLGETKPTPRRR